MVTSVFRQANTMYVVENGGSSGESSRRPSAVEVQTPRRPSLATISLRLSSRSKRSNSAKANELGSESMHKLWESFLSLPDEITAQILCYLSFPDIFALRLTSRTVLNYLQFHAGPVTRSILLQNAYEQTTEYDGGLNHEKARYFYDYIHTIYPPPRPCESFDYLLQTLKRQSQIQKQLLVVTNWIQMKVYVFPKFKRCDNFNPYKHKMIRRLHLAAWTIYHFLESYRNILVSEHPNHKARSIPIANEANGCYGCLQAISKILQSYPGKDVIPAYHFYDLCRQHLHALSRAPSAGRLRAKKSPSDGELMQYIVLGGIQELSKLSLLKGSSNQRIEVISGFVDKIQSTAIQQRIRGNLSSSSSQTDGRSSSDLMSPFQIPFGLIHLSTISALPVIDNFIVGTDEWVTSMYTRVESNAQIVSAWGFITNILTGKSEDTDSDEGQQVKGLDSDLDFLAPVKAFED